MRPLLLLVVVTLLAGCAASQVSIAPDAVQVKTGSRPPAGQFEQLGVITAKHGGGCGLYGQGGDLEGAYTILRNRAAQMGADYVQILRVTGPHMEGICHDRAFVIDGLAYKTMGTVAPPVAAPSAVIATPSTGLSGTFAGRISGIQGSRSITMGVSFTIVQTENKIAGVWSSTGGTSGTLTATLDGEDLTEVRIRQINPCEAEFAGVVAVEAGGSRLRGSYLGDSCGSPVNASFLVDRAR